MKKPIRRILLILIILIAVVAVFLLAVRMYFRLPVADYYKASEKGFTTAVLSHRALNTMRTINGSLSPAT